MVLVKIFVCLSYRSYWLIKARWRIYASISYVVIGLVSGLSLVWYQTSIKTIVSVSLMDTSLREIWTKCKYFLSRIYIFGNVHTNFATFSSPSQKARTKKKETRETHFTNMEWLELEHKQSQPFFMWHKINHPCQNFNPFYLSQHWR